MRFGDSILFEEADRKVHEEKDFKRGGNRVLPACPLPQLAATRFVRGRRSVSDPGGYPTGTVQFQVGGNNLGQPQQITQKSFVGGWHNFADSPATSSLASGSHIITANYSGDSNYNAGSNTLTQVVKGHR